VRKYLVLPNISFIFVVLKVKYYFMWLFSYFKKKKEEKLRKEKLRYNEKKLYIDDYVKKLKNTEYAKQKDALVEYNENAKKNNSICPNCYRKDVIKIFKRNKGEINGSIDGKSSSSHSSFLFSSYSHHSNSINGNIEGNLDTLRVNKCNHCGHEWNIIEIKHWFDNNDYYSGKIDWKFYTTNLIQNCIWALKEIDNFNPYNLNEECNNIEEKIEQQVNKIKEKYCYKYTHELSMEVLYYFVRIYYDYHSDYKKIFTPTNNSFEVDTYMGRFNKRIENFLVNYLGYKYNFND
jgi:hypothetical protein